MSGVSLPQVSPLGIRSPVSLVATSIAATGTGSHRSQFHVSLPSMGVCAAQPIAPRSDQ